MGQVTLRHDGLSAELGERFEDHIDVGVILFNAENCATAHAIEWLEDHVAMRLVKFLQARVVGADQQLGAALWKLRREHLLVAVAQ